MLEVGAEGNNTVSSMLSIGLAPYADLQVSDVTSPVLLIADPARITVGWTVTNIGTGEGITARWTDSVVLSKNAIAGDSDDIIIGRFDRVGGLSVGASYSRLETLFALLYSYGWDAQWPSYLQLTACVLFVLGILASIRAHR